MYAEDYRKTDVRGYAEMEMCRRRWRRLVLEDRAQVRCSAEDEEQDVRRQVAKNFIKNTNSSPSPSSHHGTGKELSVPLRYCCYC